MLNALNLYSKVCQLFLNKIGEKSYGRGPKSKKTWIKNSVCVCFFNLEIHFSSSSSKQPLYLILKLGNEVE